MEKVDLNSKAVKLTTLVLAVAANNQAYALEMYNDETTKLNIYGAIGVHVTRNNFGNGEILFIEDGTLVEDPDSYVGVSASHTLAPFSIYAASQRPHYAI